MILLSAFSKFGEICSSHTIEILTMLLGTALLTWLLRGLFASKPDYSEWETRVTNLTNDNEGLRRTIASLESHKGDLNNKLSIAYNDHDATKLKYNNLMSEKDGYITRIAALDNDNNKWKSDLEGWKLKYTTLETDKNKLSTTIAAQDSDLAAWKAKYTSLETAQKDADAKLQAANQKLSAIESEWKVKYGNLEKEKGEANIALEAKNKEVEIWRTRITDLETADKNWAAKFATLDTERNNLVATIAANKESSSEWETKYNTLYKDYHGLEDKYTNLVQTHDGESNRYTTLNKEYDALKDKYNNLVQAHDGESNRYTILHKEYDALEDKYNNLVQAHDGESNRYTILHKEHDVLLDKYNGLVQEHEGWRNRYIILEQKISGLEAAASKAQMFSFMGKAYYQDDLKIVEGIGPKIEQILHGSNVKTWKQLSQTSTDRLRAILSDAGDRYRLHDPSTWAQQAGLADAHNWDTLAKFQDELNAGKKDSGDNAERVSYKQRLRELEKEMKGAVLVDKDRLAALERESLAEGARVYGKKIAKDDLTIVEGIGEKIAELLINAGIKTWYQLSEATPERIKEILENGGGHFAMHDPTTWPEQATLADKGRWERLKKLQDELNAGKRDA
ncbi:MAG: hypothetical protein KA974_04300 [Saprospiraceae bacterium]|nr:hypothetical protein [Saprospiraceae bacterium]MBP7679734.1 hypothetical protein [Saprospiraceae bacterium]